ncbi:SIMPL domain-containing protein [Sagittula salina]|uniref:SIMPL domain-containing protein n=1 Tax=Sagittula salina TaxID=2820268 RepID=A0A940MKR0_9RHOB|nr:SIMPL domain-containing protein [Sagittula salina]MBP0481149.1 SIMPL domain-containing protein [Sagittula salina]
MRVLSMILGAALAGAMAFPALAEEPARMTVAGEAHVVGVPDMARVSLGAEGRGQTPVEAMDATSAALEGIIAKLKALGVADKDIQTRGLSVNEETRWDRDNNTEIFIGYLSRNTVEVRVRDMDLLGEILGQVLTEGANRLDGLNFEMQDDAPLRAEARRSAVRDAVEKATLFAEAAGVRVGRVVSITDTATPMVEGPMMKTLEPAMEAASDARAVPVAVGEVTTRAEVTMVFEILQ